MKGIPWHIFPTVFLLSSALSRDSSPAKTNEAQTLRYHYKNPLRVKEVDLLKSKKSAALYRILAVECGLARFCEQGEFIC